MVEEQVDTSHCNRINRSRDTVVACWRREGGVGRTKTIGEGRIRGAQLRCRWKKKKDESERQRERTRFKEETHHLWKNRRRRRRRRKGGGGAKKKLLFREGDFLGSVRGPTGCWNPRSRLIAIKAPLGPRLWIFYSQSSSFSLYAGAHTVLHRVHHASPPPFLFRSVIRKQAKPLSSSSSSLSREYRERSLLLLCSPLLSPFGQFETSEFEYGRPGSETMGTSTDHTGCEQMVQQPEDMRSGNRPLFRPPFQLARSRIRP